jgi:hypothetical protein
MKFIAWSVICVGLSVAQEGWLASRECKDFYTVQKERILNVCKVKTFQDDAKDLSRFFIYIRNRLNTVCGSECRETIDAVMESISASPCGNQVVLPFYNATALNIAEYYKIAHAVGCVKLAQGNGYCAEWSFEKLRPAYEKPFGWVQLAKDMQATDGFVCTDCGQKMLQEWGKFQTISEALKKEYASVAQQAQTDCGSNIVTVTLTGSSNPSTIGSNNNNGTSGGDQGNGTVTVQNPGQSKGFSIQQNAALCLVASFLLTLINF